jgi:hypothetical protein
MLKRAQWELVAVVGIAILSRMTARPDAAPAEVEGRGSWADMVCCFQQSMRERIKYMIRAVGINTKQNNHENNIIFLGGWKSRGIPKGGFGHVLARKAKKGEKFLLAGKAGLKMSYQLVLQFPNQSISPTPC